MNITTTHLTIDDGLGKLDLTEISPTKWLLLHSFTYVTNSGIPIVVPEGFATDGASSPLRILIQTFGGRYSTASIIHDFLYSRINEGNPHPAAPTRMAADVILMEAMTRANVNFWTRWGMYIAVRTFGGPEFRWIGVRS